MSEIRNRNPQNQFKATGTPDDAIKTRNQPQSQHKGTRAQPKRTRVLLCALVLIILAIGTRLFSLNYPDEVVFDEVHFGKFSSYYLSRKFHFDVHPELGKMMFALMAWIRGYDGSYLFDKISDVYAEHNVPYVFMRSMPALLGSALVPIVYKILLESGHSLQASVVGASMVLFDTALTTQCRFILLDSPLLFFDIMSVFAWIKFYKQRHQTFSPKWWMWMFMTGACISFTISVKMVGLFVVGLVGISTLIDLWRLIDERKGLSDMRCLQEFLSRVVGLIALPFTIYLFWYAVHFAILKKSGPGDAFMSPGFQASLEGSRFNQDSKGVFYNATVSILHYKTNAYLHSHAHAYPLRYEDGRVSSQGQQVTGYPHNDTNNMWRVIPADGVYITGYKGKRNETKIVRLVRNKDIVQLYHITTKKYLLTHDVASPLTPTHQEVTAVNLTHPDFANRRNETLFKVDILNDPTGDSYIASIDTQFRLIHVPTGVAVSCHKGKLADDWGFGQQEINGNKNKLQNSNKWIVDYVSQEVNSTQRRSMQGQKGPGFLSKYLELQSIQLRENSNLVKSHPYQSQPTSWPVLLRGISFWVKEPNRQVYLIGNPIVWYLGLFCVFLLGALMVIDAIISRRGLTLMTFTESRHLNFTGGFFLLGWACHYLPFFIMGRVLFLHHYLPALIFTFLITANVFDFALRKVSNGIKTIVALFLVLSFAVSFYFFAPFTYGWPLTPAQIESRRWMKTWDFTYGQKTT